MDIDEAQNLLSEPVPWIGMYVAAASLLCTLLMAADVINGFRRKKYWIPSKYFCLNATTLALLSVAMKLPMDFATPMFDVTDRLARLSSVAMLATCMANFFTSLGSLDDSSVLMNVTALAILAAVDVFIHVCQLRSQWPKLVLPEELVAIGGMLILLVMLASSSLMLSTSKRHLEMKYQEMHTSALNEVDMRGVSTAELKTLVQKYWVMAETSSPQFVIARCVTCTSAGVVSFLILLVLMEAHIRMLIKNRTLDKSDSSYNWSTKWILLTQTMGVLVGTIAPASRWFIAISFRSSNSISETIRTAFNVEAYWLQKLLDMKQHSLSYKIRHRGCRKVVHNIRGHTLKFLIFIQSSIIRVSKLFLLVSVFVATPVQLCFKHINSLRMWMCESNLSTAHTHQAPVTNFELDVGHYVIQLQGEVKLPWQTQACISQEVDRVILRGTRSKPTHLLEFLRANFGNFEGLVDFDCHIRVPNIDYKHLPNLQLHRPTSPNSHVFQYCWSLPIVTLVSIAFALPNIESSKSSSLLKSVSEGLAIVKHVDKSMDGKGNLLKIRNAADVVWNRIELHHKWQDKEHHVIASGTCTNSEILQQMSDKAEATVLEFTKNTKECVMRNPMNWPPNVISAYAMHRISKTILLSTEAGNENEEEDDGRLFHQISVMIADIISACLTNLPSVITMRCHRSAIEKREESVAKAALLLGQTQEILQLLHQCHGLPLPTPCQKACIEDWRVFIKQRNTCDIPNANAQVVNI